MKFVLAFVTVAAIVAVAHAGAAPVSAVAASVPSPVSVGLFDNPNTDTNPVAAIPSAPDCTVRPQTIVEIKRMRKAAARIASMIHTEVAIMEKRKTYVEQMTSYLNDRIRELNKVKSELAQEERWIEVSNQRIAELAEKEKLIKMQDILSCLSENSHQLMGKKQSQSQQMNRVKQQAAAISAKINQIKGTIAAVNNGAKPNAVGGAPGGAPGGPAPAL